MVHVMSGWVRDILEVLCHPVGWDGELPWEWPQRRERHLPRTSPWSFNVARKSYMDDKLRVRSAVRYCREAKKQTRAPVCLYGIEAARRQRPGQGPGGETKANFTPRCSETTTSLNTVSSLLRLLSCDFITSQAVGSTTCSMSNRSAAGGLRLCHSHSASQLPAVRPLSSQKTMLLVEQAHNSPGYGNAKLRFGL